MNDDENKNIIKPEFDVNATDKNGETPLHRAVWGTSATGDVGKIKELIAAGAPLEAKDNRGRTPLHEAVTEGYEEAMDVLVEAGADVNTQVHCLHEGELTENFGHTPLFTAVCFAPYLVQPLIEAGADVNKKCGQIQVTALHHAVSHIKLEAIQSLLGAGADVNAKSALGGTPLDGVRAHLKLCPWPELREIFEPIDPSLKEVVLNSPRREI